MMWKQACAAVLFLTAGQAIASTPATRKSAFATYAIVYGQHENVCEDALHLYNRLLDKDQRESKEQLSDFEVSRPMAFHNAGFLEPPTASQIYSEFNNGFMKARAYEISFDRPDKPNVVVLLDRHRGRDPFTTIIIFKRGVYDPLLIKEDVDDVIAGGRKLPAQVASVFNNSYFQKKSGQTDQTNEYFLTRWPHFADIISKHNKNVRSAVIPAINNAPTMRIYEYKGIPYLLVNQPFLTPGSIGAESVVLISKLDNHYNLIDVCYIVAMPTLLGKGHY